MRVNWPLSLVTTVLVALVPVLTMVTVTPGRTPPDESTTRPLMVPRDSCATAVAAPAIVNSRQTMPESPAVRDAQC